MKMGVIFWANKNLFLGVDGGAADWIFFDLSFSLGILMSNGGGVVGGGTVDW